MINPEINGGLLVNGSRVLLVWGSDGTILRSTDAGKTWQTALNATNDTDLLAVIKYVGSRT